MKYPLIALISTILLMGGCKKEDEPNSNLWGFEAKVNVEGRVMDENGNAIQGATAQTGSVTATTDNNGYFHLSNATVFEKLGFVKVSKQGYFTGSRSFVPTEGTNILNIRMLEQNIAGNVSGTNGGDIQSEGVKISFTGGTFVRNNSPYNGQVKVALNYIDPESQFFYEEMPGNLIAIQNENSVGLKSYGMVAVELTDENDNEIKLSEGATATLSFPVHGSMQADAPSTIDLWSFDEANGYWINEGKATLQNDFYVANVSHFSFWNCDIPISAIIINGQITDTSGTGLPGAIVTITSSTQGSGTDQTSSTGHFGGYIPAGEVLQISVEIECDNFGYETVYTGQIGPFSTATTLAPIAVSNSSIQTIVTGIVTDCFDNPVTNGYVIANGQTYSLNNGQFNFTVCGTSLTLTPYVESTGEPEHIILTGGTYDADTLKLCDTTGCQNVNCPVNAVCIDGQCHCIAGYEGASCDVLTYEKYVGAYQVSENCTTTFSGFVNQQFTSNISVGFTIDRITISNFANRGIPVDAAIVDSTYLFITEQTSGAVDVSGGEGFYQGANNQVRLEYNYTVSGNFHSCTAIFTKF